MPPSFLDKDHHHDRLAPPAYTSPKPPSVATTPRLLTHNSRSNGSQHTSAMMALAAMAHRTKPAGASTTIAPLVDVANTIHGGPAVVGDDRCTLLVWNDLSVALIGARDGVPCAHPHALSLSITALREAGMRVHKGAHILATKLLAPRLLAEGRAWDATLAKTTIGWTERRDRPPFYHDIDPDPTLFAKEADIVRLDRPNTPFLALLAAHLRRWQQAYPQHADRWWWTLRLGIPHQSGRWFVHPTLT